MFGRIWNESFIYLLFKKWRDVFMFFVVGNSRITSVKISHQILETLNWIESVLLKIDDLIKKIFTNLDKNLLIMTDILFIRLNYYFEIFFSGSDDLIIEMNIYW